MSQPALAEIGKTELADRGIRPVGSDRLPRAVVVGAVLMSTVMVGLGLGLRRSGVLRPEVIIGAVLVALSVPLWFRLRTLEIGIVAVLLAGGLLNMITLPTGTQTRLPLSLVAAAGVVGLWILRSIGRPPGARLRPSRINAPLLIFVATGFASYGWGQLMRDPTVYVWDSFPFVQLGALAVNTLLPLLTLVAANEIEDVRWLKAITWSVLAMGAFAVVSYLLGLPTTPAISSGSRGLFATWIGVMAYSQALLNRDLNRFQRLLLLTLFAAVVYLYFIRYVTWLSGWVPLAISCAVATVLYSRRLTVVVAIVVGVYLAVNASFYFTDLVQIKVESGSLERLTIWDRSLELVRLHPLLGMGPAGYAVYNVSYFPQDARSTHNNYFDILAQSGIIGLAAFLWLVAGLVRTGATIRNRLRHRPGFELAFANATLAGTWGVLVSMMLGDWVLPFAYNQTLTGFDNAALTWVLLGAMVSLNWISLQRKGAGEVAAGNAEAG